MKTKNLVLLSSQFIALSLMAQPFEYAYHGPLDHNHHSIKTLPSGQYIGTGTLFDTPTNNNDIHVFMLNNNGTMSWERTIDISPDDRGLAITTNPSGSEIVITGFVTQAGPNSPEMYVARLDLNGNILQDAIIGGFPTAGSAGTYITYSQITGNYIVGGFHADPPVMYPLSNNEAVLVELDFGTLAPINTVTISSSGSLSNHSSINGIEEVGGAGYFVTGSVESPGGTESVLAILVDPALNIYDDLSFYDGSSMDQRGVSASYVPSTDEIYLVSNYDATNNVQLRVISSASGGAFISNEFDLMLIDADGNTLEGSAFQLIETPWNTNSLILAGRFVNGYTGNDSNPWLVEIDKISLSVSAALSWNITSNNFANFGPSPIDPLFSTFVGPHPYIYNQEIVTRRADNMGVVLVSPTDILTPYYGIDIVTSDYMNAVGCFDRISGNLDPISSFPTPININYITTFDIPLGTGANPKPLSTDWNCYDATQPRSPITGDGSEENNGSKLTGLNENTNLPSLSIYPNPTNDFVTLTLSGEINNAELIVQNSVGQTVYQSTVIQGKQAIFELDLTDFASGVYLIQVVNGDNIVKEKLIKL